MGIKKMDIVIAHMEEAGTNVSEFIKNNGRLPNYVSCICYDNIQDHNPIITEITMPQFLYAATALFGSGGSAEILNVSPATSPSGEFQTGDIPEAEYRTVAENIENFIEVNGRAPNYANSSLGELPFETLIDMYARIWALWMKITDHQTM